MRKRIYCIFLILTQICINCFAQEKENIINGLEVAIETQGSIADGTTPLWLNANKYGLSSLESQNGYLRASAIRPLSADCDRQWKWGYGVDIVGGINYNAKVFVHQAFAEMQWKKLRLSLGAKEQPVEYTNQELSSGALTLGCNARPIPQARIDLDWFSFPGTNNWVKMKLHGSLGMTTDGNWQKSVVPEKEHYTSNVAYHEKSIFWKFGKETNTSFPLTFEFGIQIATEFAGTSYNIIGRGYDHPSTIKHPFTLQALLDAVTASGSDETDGSSKNTAGNHVGSWNMRLAWHGQDWNAGIRFERMFEDQSMMFIQYGIFDHLVGLDITFPRNPFVSTFTMEHMSSYDQSGAVMHDAALNIPDKMNGRDNYYNHNLYIGYQHWGQSMGSPLLTSPVYNSNGSLIFRNNRVKAFHFGLAGDPLSWIHWRALVTFTRNWGGYDTPLEDPTNQQYYLVEATAKPHFCKGWEASIGLGLDHGKVIGNNHGAQITLRKAFKFQ